MKQLVLNGSNKHPGVNFVEIYWRTQKKFLSFADRKEMAQHLEPEDIVFFIRQPNLHRIPIMAKRG